MKDTSEQNRSIRRTRQVGEPPEDRLADLLPSYVPKQRKTLLKGLRILARVAVRTHMKRQRAATGTPCDDVDGAQKD